MDSSQQFTVDRILSHRVDKSGKIKFLVLWEDFDLKDATWEPEENLYCIEVVEDYYKNPRPNVTKEQLLREARKAKDQDGVPSRNAVKKQQISTMPEKSDRSLRKRTAASATSQTTRGSGSKSKQDSFDWKAFLKLGCLASSVVIIFFIIFGNLDRKYIASYLERQANQAK